MGYGFFKKSGSGQCWGEPGGVPVDGHETLCAMSNWFPRPVLAIGLLLTSPPGTCY
jgi:hypothetical protein